MIITHIGRGHTDDFLATCVLLHKLDCQAYRTVFKQEYLDDPDCWVIDQGMLFNPDMKNFDHHHIKEEICAFTMILDHFYGKDYRLAFPSLKFIEIADSFGPKAAAQHFGLPENVAEIMSNPIVGSMLDLFSAIDGQIVGMIRTIMMQIGRSICKRIEDMSKTLLIIDKGAKFSMLTLVESNKTISLMDITYCELTDGFTLDQLPTKAYCSLHDLKVDVILTKDSRGSGYRMVSNNVDKIKFLPNDLSYFVHNSGFLVNFEECSDYIKIINEYSII